MNRLAPSLEWLRTDEWKDTAYSLHHLVSSLELVQAHPQEWKWAILACHSALQGALVCVLSGSNGLGCLTDAAMKKMVAWLEASRTDEKAEHPEEWVAELPELLSRSHDLNYMSEFGGAPVPSNAEIDRDILRLHEFRNRFTHFRPVSWSIEIKGLPYLVNAALNFAQLLLLGHPASTYRLNEGQIRTLRELFGQLSDLLKKLGADGLSPEPTSSLRR